MLSIVATLIVLALTIALTAVTVLPFTSSQAWWIQGMDFARIHYILLAVLLIAATLWLRPWGTTVIVGVVALSLVYHGWRVFPYTSLSKREIGFVGGDSGHPTIGVMAANVLMENDRYADLGGLIADTDPDVLFLMETDDTWVEALSPWLERYPSVLRHPLDNHYGLVLATRLKVRDMRVRYLTTDTTPTAFAELETPDGQVFRFVGMHPRPPVPGVDTEERDAQMAYTARFAHDADVPVVVMGDFNAAAWSDVSQGFKSLGRYLDPRIGRGPIPSFDANHWLMRFPIDQLYVTQNVAVAQFGRGPAFGSDHFPMIADLVFDADLAARQNRPMPPMSSTRQDAVRQMMEKHAESLDRVHGGKETGAD